MFERTRLVSAVAAIALVAASACGSKPKKDSTVTDSTGGGTATQDETKVEPKVQEATGELRELLLTLKRVHFAFDSEELTPESRTALEKAGEQLSKLPDVHLYVEGHADERGTAEYNIALADGRARTVSDFLIALGVESGNLHVLSKGEEEPLVTGSSRLAYAKNRRVDFRLMKGDITFVLAEGDLVDDKGEQIDEEDGDSGGDAEPDAED